jgi:hypothetical protein
VRAGGSSPGFCSGEGDATLNIYTIYIHDDRYSVPNLDIIDAQTDDEARAEAILRLNASPHHQAIEIWTLNGFLARIEAGEQV